MKPTQPSETPDLKPKPRRVPPKGPRRRRVIRAVKIWAAVTLSGVVVVSSLIVWGLIRRARLIRGERLEPKSKPAFRDPLDL